LGKKYVEVQLEENTTHVTISDNQIIQSLSGIDNITASTIIDLSITGNPVLSSCDVKSICDYLVSPNGEVEIHDNAPGCNSQAEVEEACTVGIPDQRSDSQLSAYPNPFTQSHGLPVTYPRACISLC